MTIVEMCVHMDCAGCEKKIRKAIQKLEGVDDVEIDMARQKVTVSGSADQKTVLKAARRTGRRAVLWPYAGDAGAQAQQYYHQSHPAAAQAHAAYAALPSSSYNYRKHGYDDARMHGAYNGRGANSAVYGHRAADYFSDENTHGCSVM